MEKGDQQNNTRIRILRKDEYGSVRLIPHPCYYPDYLKVETVEIFQYLNGTKDHSRNLIKVRYRVYPQ